MTIYFYYFIRIYIITVLSYSNSCMYWYLAYIYEGISALCIYVAVTSPYLRDRDITISFLSIPKISNDPSSLSVLPSFVPLSRSSISLKHITPSKPRKEEESKRTLDIFLAKDPDTLKGSYGLFICTFMEESYRQWDFIYHGEQHRDFVEFASWLQTNSMQSGFQEENETR